MNTTIRHTLAVALACALFSPCALAQEAQDPAAHSDAMQQPQQAAPEMDAAQQDQNTTAQESEDALPKADATQPAQDSMPEKTAQQQPPDAMPKMGADQQAMMQAWLKAATPGPQHKQLADHFAGKWNVRQTMWMDPAAPPTTTTGTDSAEMVLGGRQVRSDFSSTFMGQPYQGIGYTGYDNVTGRYTSTWADNMSTGTMLAYGDYAPGTKTYTFKAEMPDPMKNGAMTPVRMVIRILDADHHDFDMYETHDGKETRGMRIEYARAR